MFKPTGNNVLIKQISKENETASGIYIPEKLVNDEKNLTGEVIAVGPGKIVEGVRHEMEVEVGHNAIYSSYHGRKVTINGDEMVVIPEDKILAVF